MTSREAIASKKQQEQDKHLGQREEVKQKANNLDLPLGEQKMIETLPGSLSWFKEESQQTPETYKGRNVAE